MNTAPVIGKKYIIATEGDEAVHLFRRGTVVTVYRVESVYMSKYGKYQVSCSGNLEGMRTGQTCYESDLIPYTELNLLYVHL